MSVKALSLIGFITDPAKAILYLKLRCAPDPADKSDAALHADWLAAKAKLGAPVARAGRPRMRPIPMSDPYLQALMKVSWAARIRHLLDQGASFQMVEIDRLIAGQVSVDLEKAAAQCAGLSRPPTQEQLMTLALPFEIASDKVYVSRQDQSIVIRSNSLNLLIGEQGPMPGAPHVIGINVGWTLPFIHAVRLKDRYILHNGYNRAVGARLAGATEIPAIVRDVPDAAAAGFEQANTVDEALLMSDNPPTMRHFAQGRALDVRLRRTTRILQVNWSQHLMYED
jgi:hypothetical protein